MFDNYPDVMTVSQVQSALSIGRGTAYALLHDGTLNYITIRGQYRIPKHFLLDYMKKMAYNQVESDADCAERSM